MIPVYQDILHGESEVPGNCLQACIASILEMPLDEVPHFVLVKSSDWFDRMNNWLLQNANVEAINIEEATSFPPRGYALLNGLSPRGVMHSVVIHNGAIVHDPHPDGGGIVEEKSYTVFVSSMEHPSKNSNSHAE